MTYRRGNGSVEVELANLQSAVEFLDPTVASLAQRTDSLESNRDWVKGALWVIMGLNVFILGILVSLATWALNHMTIKANFDSPTVSQKQDAGASYSEPR